MTPERYRQIGELYHSLLEVDANERAAFLERECRDDAELRREVESLIASHEQAPEFIAAPALAVAAELLADDEADALIGRTIARYRVLSLLGAGGMGRVYLSEDTDLGRRVALKLLPKYFTNDKHQVQRFRQEARAASALNHPNILTVHEVGQVDGSEFIATEYIEGETLRARLTRARLPLYEALDVAEQVADALVAAHDAGIVHRDIKPENIMLRRDGYVKVLDFGLAKLTQSFSEQKSKGPTAQFVSTNPGVVMGTVQYMSPEQVRSLDVDARADVWSLGVVLYEMVAGRGPFAEDTQGDTIVSILERKPQPLSRYAPEVPEELERIVTRALTKDANDRYQTAREMSFDLRRFNRRLEVEAEIQGGGTEEGDAKATRRHAVVASQGEPSPLQSNPIGVSATTSSLEFAISGIKRHKTAVALVAILCIAALTGVTISLFKFLARARDKRQATAPFKIVPLTSTTGVERNVAFSPDGKQIAFTSLVEGANFEVYVKLVGAGEPLRLTNNPARDMSPAWSPDGRYIAFLRAGEGRGCYIIPALGGAERKLSDFYGWTERGVMNQGVAWSPDGRTLALVDKASDSELWSISLVSVETGERRKFTNPPRPSQGDNCVAFSRDGQRLAFVRSNDLVADIYVAPIAGGEPVRLTFDEAVINGLAWTPNGAEIVFSAWRAGGSTLWRIPAAGGPPALIVGIGDSVFDLSISAQGRLAFAQLTYDSNIYSVELTDSATGRQRAGQPTSVISTTRVELDPQFSPDGRRVVFISNRSGNYDLWVCDADGKNAVQLTDDGTLEASWPRWSPDGRSIVFSFLTSGNADIYSVSADGGAWHRLTTAPSWETTPSWSPDGTWLYFSSNRTGRDEVWKMPAAGGAEVQLTHGGGVSPVVAADGQTVYYLLSATERGLWAVSTDGGAETRVFDKKVEQSNWVVVRRGIYFFERKSGEPDTLEFFDFKTGRPQSLTTVGGASGIAQVIGLTVAPDERSILYGQRDRLDIDLMMVENFR